MIKETSAMIKETPVGNSVVAPMEREECEMLLRFQLDVTRFATMIKAEADQWIQVEAVGLSFLAAGLVRYS
jgi:hypothetical protein